MRLGKMALEAVEMTVQRALSGECVVRVPAPSRCHARAIFKGASPHVERMGGCPQTRDLSWRLPNGSLIVVMVDSLVRVNA